VPKRQAVRTKDGGDFWEFALEKKKMHDDRSLVHRYFFDLNAVEAILLASITVISLSGIMFESGQFTTRPDLYWTGQMTTALVFILLFGTLAYYLAVSFFLMSFIRCFELTRIFNRYSSMSSSPPRLPNTSESTL